MDNAMRKIKGKNKELNIQDTNYSKLFKKLENLINELELDLVDKQRLKDPNLNDEHDYNDALSAAKILIKKLELEFPDGLEGMAAVRSKKKEFQFLKRTFCEKVKEFCKKEFETFSRQKNKSNNNNNNEFIINSHKNIHNGLMKHSELMRCMDNLDVNKLVDLQLLYEKIFSQLYLIEFRDFFKLINANIDNNQKDSRNLPCGIS